MYGGQLRAIFKKQSRKADEGWSFSVGVGAGSNSLVRNVKCTLCFVLGTGSVR
jgi:hypothetical protein